MLGMATRKDKGRKTPRKGEAVNFWLDDALAAALNSYLDSVKPRSSKKAVLELALEEYLTKQGHWPPSAGE